ncbi:hypothetical protein SAMN06265379_101453 [Saccharicrinis carchari]|uniref:TIGR01777 family protein n=1 Tax=Saccharicrinis carchari TaxID=1168039 RepID=A0A521AW46_SACCC|nr:TIGR01777 family oxidoreductase [Saccharicrinis carchari]SMO39025.1 hypothetical protein SAMN06265379_101453 [Saccharicrinis carchari]
MKVCLTGGTGFIGSRLSQLFKDNNIQVVHITRVDLKKGPKAIAQKVEGAGVVINLAGSPILKRWTEPNKQTIRDSRVETTKKLVEAILMVQNKPSMVMSASAVGIYDTVYEHDEFSDRLGKDFLASVCMEWEAALAPLLKTDIKLTVLRLGIVLDRQEGALAKMITPFKLGLGTVVGDGTQPFPCIHINDLLSAVWYILNHPKSSGIYNLVAPEMVSNHYFSKTLGKKLHRPVILRAYSFILKLLLGEGANALLKGQKVRPRRLLELGYPFQFPTIDSILQDLVIEKS